MGDASRKIPREKIALVIFVAMIIAGLTLASMYFLVGRQLNTTATVVDDATGNMQDYSIVAFAGVAKDPKLVDVSKSEESLGEDVYARALGQAAASSVKSELISAYKQLDVHSSLLGNHLFVSDVRNAYELKGAEVITIDISNLKKYSEPTIIGSGMRTFGVFSTTTYISKAKLKTLVEGLRTKGAQSIICLTTNISNLSTFNGLDAVVSLTNVSDEERSASLGSTLLIDAPSKDEVGVILFSKTNVSSYKTVKTI